MINNSNKKVLVIIDNLTLYVKFKRIINLSKVKAVFIFRHSKFKSEIWSHPDFKDNPNAVVDVKNETCFIINNYDLVISVHCRQFFPKKLVEGIRCINIHPGYNPINRGWYPQVFAIINNLKIGATIHEMDDKLDHGNIVDRKFDKIYIDDTSLTVYNRIINLEMELFENNLNEIIENRYSLIEPENNGNFYTKENFSEICEIDLNEVGTFKSFYDKLRALTHGKYKNAFFIDKNSNKKVFISLNIDTNELNE